MSKLLEGVKSQYIDDNGKTRMLKYKDVCFITSPLPPLNLPSQRKIERSSLEAALKFVKTKDLKIVSQDGTNDTIKGFWVEMKSSEPEIYYGYIPINDSKPLKNVEFTEESKIAPLQDESYEDSELQTFRRNRKIAEFLKMYALYTYSLDPDNFGKKSFIVDPTHQYDIESLDKKLFSEGNEVMYDSKKRMIVPSQEALDKLMSYVQIKLTNNKPGVLDLKNAKKIQEYYKNISDFHPSPNQLIFTSVNGILRWKRELIRAEKDRTISQNLLPDSIEPYFYRTHKIKKSALHIIQNVTKGSLKNAIAVSYKWIKDRVNVGYGEIDKIALPNDISYISYTNNGPVPGGKHKGETEEFAPVIFYDDATYGAILFLDEN